MRRLLTSFAALAFLATAGTGFADAKTCRDAHGRFMKCSHMAMTSNHCRDKKGRFVKCHH
jgi:hypothetical protein